MTTRHAGSVREAPIAVAVAPSQVYRIPCVPLVRTCVIRRRHLPARIAAACCVIACVVVSLVSLDRAEPAAVAIFDRAVAPGPALGTVELGTDRQADKTALATQVPNDSLLQFSRRQ